MCALPLAKLLRITARCAIDLSPGGVSSTLRNGCRIIFLFMSMLNGRAGSLRTLLVRLAFQPLLPGLSHPSQGVFEVAVFPGKFGFEFCQYPAELVDPVQNRFPVGAEDVAEDLRAS